MYTKLDLHLLLDKVQSLFNGLLGFCSILRHQSRADQLVHGVLWFELGELLELRGCGYVSNGENLVVKARCYLEHQIRF